MRKIPKTMATQHPDNAKDAFWLKSKFISSRDEVKECLVSFSDFGCDEFMWDWEGKYVDEAVIERLFEENTAFFKENKLGKDFFLTFRIPNIWVEKGSFRILRAFANILSAYDIAKELGFYTPPLFEVILPLTTSAEQMLYLQEKFVEFAAMLRKDKSKKIGSGYPKTIEIIPLIEDIPHLLSIGGILSNYILSYRKNFSRFGELKYIRPFIARSDPALNYGLISAVLAAKIAIHLAHEVGKKYEIKIFPILGCGTMPFRGHLSPYNLKNFFNEYSNIETITLQSSYRYDYPLEDVKNSIQKISEYKKNKPYLFSNNDLEKLKNIISINSRYYRYTITKMSGLINTVAKFIPSRRERRLHVGLFGYSRELRKGVTLPRAIAFTATMYSLGLPPEIIGTGRTLNELYNQGLFDFLKENYINLTFDIKTASEYVNIENVKIIEKEIPDVEIGKDIEYIEKFLKIDVGPTSAEKLMHKNLTSNILLGIRESKNVRDIVEETAVMRNFLG